MLLCLNFGMKFHPETPFSAIEAAIDRIGLEKHRLSKRAKDIGSAAVFVALLNVAVVWASILLDLTG